MNWQPDELFRTRHQFETVAKLQARDLAVALWAGGYMVDPDASARPLVRLARACNPDGDVYARGIAEALTAFETAVRPSLAAYVAAASALDGDVRHILTPEALFLVEHFDRYTEVPVSPTPIQRVVIWARRHYRALRKAFGHD